MRSVRPTFVRIWRKANELTTHAQRVASALDVYSVHAERIKIAHVKKIQRVPACCCRPERMARACIAGHALETRWVCATCALRVR